MDSVAPLVYVPGAFCDYLISCGYFDIESFMVRLTRAALPVLSEIPYRWCDAVKEVLAGKSANTLEAYRRDLGAFAAWVGVSSIDDAAGALLGGSRVEANALARRFRDEALDSGLAASTVSRRLSALRTLAKVCKALGLIDYDLDVVAPKDTKDVADRRLAGVGRETVEAIVREASRQSNAAKAARDEALLGLMFANALRVSEVCSVNAEDFDPEAETIAVQGKGRKSKTVLTVGPQTSKRLSAWLRIRGDRPGPVFTTFRGSKTGARITRRSVSRLLDRLAKKASATRLRTHDIRRASITNALDLTGGNVREVQQFARHADPSTTIRYDQSRQDFAGKIARMVEVRLPELSEVMRGGATDI